MSLCSTVAETFQPRHHPEHRPSSRGRPWHPRALLRPWKDVLTQYPLLRRGQECGPEGLPEHDSGLLRLPIMSRFILSHTRLCLITRFSCLSHSHFALDERLHPCSYMKMIPFDFKGQLIFVKLQVWMNCLEGNGKFFAKSPTRLNTESFYDMAVMNFWRDFFSFCASVLFGCVDYCVLRM